MVCAMMVVQRVVMQDIKYYASSRGAYSMSWTGTAYSRIVKSCRSRGHGTAPNEIMTAHSKLDQSLFVHELIGSMAHEMDIVRRWK